MGVAPDIVALVCGQITDSIEALSIALQTCVSLEPDDPALLETAENYTNHMQDNWETAEMVGLTNVLEVYTFITANWTEFLFQDTNQKRSTQTYFEQWPQKVLECLQEPIRGAPALIQFLQDSGWPQPLEEADAHQLLSSLIDDLSDHSTVSETTPIQESVALVDPDVLELICNQIIDSQEALSISLQACVSLESDDPRLLETAESYTNNIQDNWDTAEMVGFNSVLEVYTFITANWTAFLFQDKKQKSTTQTYFEQWPQKVLEYLQEPTAGSAALVLFLQDLGWPQPLEDTEAHQLLSSLTMNLSEEHSAAEKTTVSENAPIKESVVLVAPDILELLCNQLTDSIEALSDTLQACTLLAPDDPALLESAESYTNHIQDNWETAEMIGFNSILEVYTFITANWTEFLFQDTAQKQNTQTYFEEWPKKVLQYFQEPTEGASALVRFLRDPAWPHPLAKNDANQLLKVLVKPIKNAEEHVPETAKLVTSEHHLQELEAVSIEAPIFLGPVDYVDMLKGELDSAKEELVAKLEQFISISDTDSAHIEEASKEYTEHIRRLYEVVEMLGLEGLQNVCTFVTDNVSALSATNSQNRLKAQKVFTTWPNFVLDYLEAPNENVMTLVNHFRNPNWISPLSDKDATVLLNKLVVGSTVEIEADASRQITANVEDVLLTIPEDIDAELWDAYLQESPEHATQFSALIQQIIQDPDTGKIHEAQRIAHSLKGSSNTVGVKAIANIAHPLEDTLEYLVENKMTPPKAMTDMMVEAADCLESMLDALMEGHAETPDDALSIFQSVLDWANRIDKGDMSAPPSPPPKETSVKKVAPKVADTPKKDVANKNVKKAISSTPEKVLKVPAKTIDEMMRLVGELSISVGQIQDRLKHLMLNTRALVDHNLVIQQKTFDLEEVVDIRGDFRGIENRTKDIASDQTFDPLEMEEYSELHSVAHSFVESIADNREMTMSIHESLNELDTMFIRQERLNKDFQMSITRTRMVPVSNIESMLQRTVRQVCKKLKKQAELVITGSDILIDSEILDNLKDPLGHILRNAIDHGLEKSEERILVEKPENGTVTLNFYREGNNIVVKCQDDGQGLNYTNIRFKAQEVGLITEHQVVTEQELSGFILMSGFSTTEKVTQVSGRGVGMDVVHSNIKKMKGTLDVSSETGKGTLFMIRLPMTLVTVHVLLLRIGKNKFGIPSNYIEQVLAPGLGEFHKVGNEVTLKMDKNFYPLRYLANLLHIPGDILEIDDQENRPTILAHTETGVSAVVVDELLETHDLVMKNMGKYVKKIKGVAGASILGDGSLVPILDLPELLQSPMQAVFSSFQNRQDSEEVDTENAVPRIMIVDDSLAVRKALSLLIEEAGYDTILAKDGLDAIEVMSEQKPNLMLVDMEMPRMNGLELTTHVRANPETKNLPIYMITSRNRKKYRDEAKKAGVDAYLTKPYQDSELLDLIDTALAK